MRIPICLDRSFVSEASNKMNTLKDNNIVHKDFLDMNVSWLPEDLELIKHHLDIFTSSVFTTARVITLAMAIIVHRAFYKLMKRLPGRAVNEMIYPNMVRYDYSFLIYLCNEIPNINFKCVESSQGQWIKL
jgi:hypothetical protein